MKKAFKILLVVGLIICISSSAVSAASFAFNFSINNSGQSFNIWGSDGNMKYYTADPWSLKLTSIYVPSYGYGMLFAPFAYDPTLVQEGIGTWKKSSGITYTSFYYSSMPLVSYTVGARVDDDYSGQLYCSSNGLFNSDYVTF